MHPMGNVSFKYANPRGLVHAHCSCVAEMQVRTISMINHHAATGPKRGVFARAFLHCAKASECIANVLTDRFWDYR
jgi:hypothetical protein